MEQWKTERDIGLDSHIINPMPTFAQGGPIFKKHDYRPTIELLPHSESSPDDIHVIHSYPPTNIRQYKKRIILLHAVPNYAFAMEYNNVIKSYTETMNAIHDYEISITHHKRHLPVWQNFAKDKDNVRYIPGGVDLDYWSPNGPPHEFPQKPIITFADMGRMVKTPADLIFSLHEIALKHPKVCFNLIGIPANNQIIWARMLAKSFTDRYLNNFVSTLIPDLRSCYRGSDLIFSHCQLGDVTRVAMEAMACGTPVIMPENIFNKSSYYYKEGNIPSCIENVIKALDDIKSDFGSTKIEARKIAEEHYDIKNTVKQFKALYEELEG